MKKSKESNMNALKHINLDDASIREQVDKYLEYAGYPQFNIRELTEALHKDKRIAINIPSMEDRFIDKIIIESWEDQIYRTVIIHSRNKFIAYFMDKNRLLALADKTSQEVYNLCLSSLHKQHYHFWWYDRKEDYYYEPKFSEFEKLSGKRLKSGLKTIHTILNMADVCKSNIYMQGIEISPNKLFSKLVKSLAKVNIDLPRLIEGEKKKQKKEKK